MHSMDGLVWDSLMLRALLNLGNEHVLRPFDLELVRRSRVPAQVDAAQQAVTRIAFFHPPKCGGTSVRKWLASAFGRPAGLDPVAAEAAARNIGVAAASEREAILAYFVQRQDTRFICGHFAYSRRAFVDREDQFELITILRNPLSRVLSRFYHSGQPDHFPIVGELADWLQTDDARAAATLFTTMFVGDIELMKRLVRGASNSDFGGAALQAIDNLKRFTIVGTLERLGAFEHAVQQRYGIRARIGHARNNPTYPRFAQQPSAVQDRLRELCREDMMIYEAFAGASPRIHSA
jgi:hypothetical protein